MILISGNFKSKGFLFCSARLIFQRQHPDDGDIRKIVNSVSYGTTGYDLDKLSDDEDFFEFSNGFNKHMEEYEDGKISFADLAMTVSADDIADFFNYLGAFRKADDIFVHGEETNPNYSFVKSYNEKYQIFMKNMIFFLAERARFARRDLSEDEARQLSGADLGLEAHLYELDSKMDETFRDVVERETAETDLMKGMMWGLLSVADQSERTLRVKILRDYQSGKKKLRNETLALLAPGKNFDLIQSLADFFSKNEVLEETLRKISSESTNEADVNAYFKELFDMKDDFDARNYLIRGPVSRLQGIFAKWGKFYQAPGRRKDSRYDKLQAFRHTFEELKKKWLSPEGGELADSEYEVHYSLKDILAGGAEVVKGQHSAEYLFEGYPLGAAAKEYVADNVAEDGKHVTLSQLLKDSDFHKKFVLQSLLVEGNEEFADLELELFEVGLSEALPFAVRSKDYHSEYNNGVVGNYPLIDVVERMEYLYPLFKRDLAKNRKMIRKYLMQRIFSADTAEYDSEAETYTRGSAYFERFFEHFSKYDFSTVKNGEVHKAKILGLKARIDDRNRYWFDVQAGVFGDGSRFNAPEEGLYYAMVALDEFNTLMKEFSSAYESLIVDGYDIEKPLLKDEDGDDTGLGFYEVHSFDYLNPYHREIFNAVFPQVASRLTVPVSTPGQ